MALTYRITENDDLILLLNLQGIANRDAPRLFLDAGLRSDWEEADRLWMHIYAEKKGIEFRPVETFSELLAELASEIDGLIIFAPDLDASRYVALTMAGLTSCLAVSPEQMRGEIARLPVREDLRGRFGSDIEAYDWALANLRPKCSDEVVHSAGQSHGDVNLGHDKGVILALDYSMSLGAFVFNLSPCAEPATYDDGKEQVLGHPEQAGMMDRIFSTYSAPAKVYGWNEPEWPFTSRISQHGHMLFCGLASNLSFHRHVPGEFPPPMWEGSHTSSLPPCERVRGHASSLPPWWRVRGHTSSLPPWGRIREHTSSLPPWGRVRERVETPESKYRLAFMTNEGDTPRVFTTFFFGAWENPERGQIPINWGINPTLIHDFPAIAEYYYSTATANDCFFAGVSGPGYSFIDRLPDVGEFARYAKPRFEMAGIDVVDAWDEFELEPARYELFAREAGVRLFTVLPRGEPGVRRLGDGTPVIVPDGRVHYKNTDVKSRIAEINAIAAEHEPPYIILLYGGLRKDACARFVEILRSLDSERFEAVSLRDVP